MTLNILELIVFGGYAECSGRASHGTFSRLNNSDNQYSNKIVVYQFEWSIGLNSDSGLTDLRLCGKTRPTVLYGTNEVTALSYLLYLARQHKHITD